MFGNYLQRTTSADDIFRCIFSWRFKGLNVDKKNYVGHDVRKTLRGFENNKGADQSTLPQGFRNNTTSPNKAVGGGTAMTPFLGQKGFSRTTFGGLDICLFGLVIFFSVSSNFLMR